jgi:glutathione S-transferase
MALPRLTYFSSRGRAEPIRMLLAEAGVEYEEVNVGAFHPKEYPEAFQKMKEAGQLAFDALPLWEEGDGLRLVQSHAIVRHLARTHGLYGASAHEAARCDMIMEGVLDARMEVMRLMATPPEKRAELRASLVESTLPRWLGYFERLVGPSGFFAGSSVTCADLAVFSLLEMVSDNRMDAALAALPKLSAFKARIAERPRIAAWLASPKRFPVQLLPT